MKEKEKEEIYIETKFQSTKLRKKMGEKKKKREKNRKGNWTGENPMYSLKSWIKRNETTESKKGETSFRTWLGGWGYILFTVSTMALHGDIVVEMPFPQCPPPPPPLW